jgi:hypothetical protein
MSRKFPSLAKRGVFRLVQVHSEFLDIRRSALIDILSPTRCGYILTKYIYI